MSTRQEIINYYSGIYNPTEVYEDGSLSKANWFDLVYDESTNPLHHGYSCAYAQKPVGLTSNLIQVGPITLDTLQAANVEVLNTPEDLANMDFQTHSYSVVLRDKHCSTVRVNMQNIPIPVIETCRSLFDDGTKIRKIKWAEDELVRGCQFAHRFGSRIIPNVDFASFQLNPQRVKILRQFEIDNERFPNGYKVHYNGYGPVSGWGLLNQIEIDDLDLVGDMLITVNPPNIHPYGRNTVSKS